MLKTLILVLALVASICNAQEGRVIYKNYPKLPDSLKSNLQSNSKDYRIKNELTGDVKNILSKFNYILYFNSNEAFFEVESILAKNYLEKMIKKSQSSFYHNRLKNETIERKETSGRIFLINKQQLKWQITNEKMNIANYNVQKAIAYKREVNPITNQERKSKVIAWFTPEIPINFGPAGYCGLPGLILKLEVMGNNFEVYDIDLAENKKTIQNFDKGEKVTEKEYLEINRELYNNYKEFNTN